MASGFWGWAVGKVGSDAVARYAGLIIELLDVKDKAAAGDNFGSAMGALGLLMKAQALVELYTDTTALMPSWSGRLVQPGPNQPDATLDTTVIAGVDDTIWHDFAAQSQKARNVQQVKDCASLLGLPVPTLPSDIAGAINTWRVNWSISGSFGAAMSPVYNDFNAGNLKTKLDPRDDHSGMSKLTVNALHQSRDPEPDDRKITEKAWVHAAVQTDTPPNLSTFLSVVDGAALADPFGLPNAVGDVLMRMFQSMKTFNAKTQVDVVHTVPAAQKWTGNVHYSRVYESAHHTSKKTKDDVGQSTTKETNESTRELGEADIEVIGEDNATGGAGDDNRSWQLSGDAFAGIFVLLHDTTAQSARVIWHTYGDGTHEYCSWDSASDLTEETRGTLGQSFATAGVTVEVSRSGTWSATGSFPDLAHNTHSEVHITGHNTDGCPPQDTVDQSYDSDGSQSGQAFTVTGTFDPANPPSLLKGKTVTNSNGVNETVTMNLNYGSPVLGPPN
jgi:hypothetical protein